MSEARMLPRCLVILTGFVGRTDGQVEPNLRAAVAPSKVTVTRRPHSQADTAEVELHGHNLPFDPRAVEGLNVSVYMADAATPDEDIRRDEFLRFVGDVDMHEGEEDAETDRVQLKARDYSGPLRDKKPIPREWLPRYSDTLHEAVERLLDNVLGDGALEITANSEDAPLARLVSGRASSDPVRLPNDCTAWQCIEYLCSLCGFIVQVRLNQLIISAARQAYEHSGEPRARLIFNADGANVIKTKTTKKLLRNRRGVKVVAYDPVKRRRVEAVFPPDSALPPRRRARQSTSTGARRRRSRAAPQPPDRDVFTVGGVTEPDALQRVAESIWNERAKQEVEVEVETPLFVETYLSMHNGDRVRFELNRALSAGINVKMPRAQVVNLVRLRLGIDRAAAELLVRAALSPPSDAFYTHVVELRYDADSVSTVRLELINLFVAEGT